MRVDEALSAHDAYLRKPDEAVKLGAQRAELEVALAGAEEQWLDIAAQIETEAK